MTPSFDHRIDSMIQAMNDAVLPAIDPTQSLAREQAQLVMAHLHLLKRQLPHAIAFDQLELEAAVTLGREIMELATGITDPTDNRQALQRALDEAARPADRQAAVRQLNGAIEMLVRQIRLLAPRQCIERTTTVVMTHAREASLRNRIWFASNGFDSERDHLPGFDHLFAATR